MASWYSRFSRKMFMALASAGRFQTECDCEEHPRWKLGEKYLADTLVTHINPKTSELSLFRARGLKSENHYLDTKGDVPGESIHWELVCSCKEIGFTPTPSPTPLAATPTPTPSIKYEIYTPTPTPEVSCTEYETWNPNKVVKPGEPHYAYQDKVQYKGKVYEVRNLHGTEKNDIPSESNHWLFLFDCIECICVPENYTEWVVTDNETKFVGGYTKGFAKDLAIHFDAKELESGPGVELDISLENSNISGKVYVDKVKIPFGGINLYATFNNICYYKHIKSLDGNLKFTLDIKAFPEICPTPSPDSQYICGEGFTNMYQTTGKSGIQESKYGMSAELFEDKGKIYYGDLQISNLNEASVYTSLLFKNEISKTPFGIVTLVGKFPTGKNYIIYESPDGSCWKANIQPNGKSIVMFRVL